MEKLKAIFVGALLGLPIAANAQATGSVNGGYIVGGGLGATECPGFLESLGKARAEKPGSTGYPGELQGFAMYVSGFQTAYNLQTPDTCDIFAGSNTSQVLDWLETFCRAHPDSRFGAGVIALARERYPTRSKKCG